MGKESSHAASESIYFELTHGRDAHAPRQRLPFGVEAKPIPLSLPLALPSGSSLLFLPVWPVRGLRLA